MSKASRLRWLCRRGMKELDLLLNFGEALMKDGISRIINGKLN